MVAHRKGSATLKYNSTFIMLAATLVLTCYFKSKWLLWKGLLFLNTVYWTCTVINRQYTRGVVFRHRHILKLLVACCKKCKFERNLRMLLRIVQTTASSKALAHKLHSDYLFHLSDCCKITATKMAHSTLRDLKLGVCDVDEGKTFAIRSCNYEVVLCFIWILNPAQEWNIFIIG